MAVARQFTRSHRVRRRGRVGFSLLEALTVLVVMGILTSFAFLVYGNHRRALRARTAARQIGTLFTTARAFAINQNAHFQAVLDLSTSGLWIDRIDQGGQVVVPKMTTPENWSVYVRVMGVSVNGDAFENGLVRIRFHPNGTADSARIILLGEGGGTHSAGDYFTVKLYSPTARSRVFAGSRL